MSEKVLNMSLMIIRSFNKCDITTAKMCDDSKYDKVNIKGIKCVMSQTEEDLRFETSGDEDKGDDSDSSTYDDVPSFDSN